MTFYEIINGLVDAGDKVLADRRSGDDYTTARKRIHDELASPHDVEVACYHEAGHWVYSLPVIGPRIEYYPATNGKPEKYNATPTGLESPRHCMFKLWGDSLTFNGAAMLFQILAICGAR